MTLSGPWCFSAKLDNKIKTCSENGDNSPDSHCIQYFKEFLPTFPKLELATPADGLIRHGGGLKPHGHSELVAGIDVMRRLIGEDIVRDDVLAE